MPQDSRRSVGYRSFVTCDDPKGVVECGTIRKSKNDSKKLKHKIESRGTPKKSITSLICKEERREMESKGITEGLNNPSTFQLLEVSRGARKLNKMIDSWSQGPSIDEQSNDIAKDLLKGALDLQESLIMLGKLQEASRYMAQLKKKQKEKSERGRNEELGSERMNSNRFGDCNYHMGFQKPRLSVDGSSRNSTEELKRVIRDSFARQNLTQSIAAQEKSCFNRRKLDSALEFPSASSSQSSLVHSDDTPFADSLSPVDSSKKTKGPNLIAKLMGLEEFPSKQFQTISQKHSEGGKTPNQKRPLFDIDMPKVRKSQSAVQKVDLERRTLKEILETMQFKGLLKCNSAKGLEPKALHSRTSHSKERLIDDMPPIVLIKPLPFPCLESKQLLAPNCIREAALDTKKILRKLKQKEEVPLKTIHCEEGILNSTEMSRKLEAEKKPVKRIREEGDRYCKELVRKSEEKEAKTKEKVSNKMKAGVSVNQKAQKKEMIDKKADNIQKATPTNRRRTTTEESVKSNNVSKSQDQAEVTSKMLRKPEIGTNISKNQTSRRHSKATNAITKDTSQSILHDSASQKIQTKKEKPVRERRAANLVEEDLGCQADGKRIDLTCENNSVVERIDTTLAVQFPLKEETDTSGLQIEEYRSNDLCSLQEVTMLSPQHEKSVKPAEEVSDHIVPSRMKRKSSKAITNLKALLSSNSSFLSRADEIFDLNVTQPTPLQTTDINDFGVANPRLSLDCAHELMELKSLQDSQTAHPLWQTSLGNSIACISLDQLVDEVCDGVEHLRSYSKLAGENLPTDSIYAMLHCDLKFKGPITGIWNLGWRNGFSTDEVEQVVVDIQKLVLNRLIEDILIDFAL